MSECYEGRPACILVPPRMIIDRNVSPQAVRFWLWLAVRQAAEADVVVDMREAAGAWRITVPRLWQWARDLSRGGYLRFERLPGRRAAFCVLVRPPT